MNSILFIVFSLIQAILSDNLSSNYGCQCGIQGIQRRIINGLPVEANRYPWFVQINDPNPLTCSHMSCQLSSSLFGCGGSLISDSDVLTAASCLPEDKEETRLILGLNYSKEVHKIKPLEIDHFIIHPNYDPKKRGNNIAIIKLKNKVKFENGLNPICLPEYDDPYFKDLFVYGFGRQRKDGRFIDAERMHEVSLNRIRDEKCEKYFKQNEYNRTLTMCTFQGNDKFSKKLNSISLGDYGTPLSTLEEGKVYQVGVASIINPNLADKINVNGFEKVSSHLDWIRQNTRDSLFCFAEHHPFFSPKSVLQQMEDKWVMG